MRESTAIKVADSYGELYENYSGRGMFGTTTTGVVLSEKYLKLAAMLIWEIELGDEFSQIQAEEWYDEGRIPYRLDNMGKDYIIY